MIRPTVTRAALLGGGEPVRPGEVSLAHRGLLLLDDLPAFGPQLLELVKAAPPGPG